MKELDGDPDNGTTPNRHRDHRNWNGDPHSP
jgi:hypothetical protein